MRWHSEAAGPAGGAGNSGAEQASAWMLRMRCAERGVACGVLLEETADYHYYYYFYYYY